MSRVQVLPEVLNSRLPRGMRLREPAATANSLITNPRDVVTARKRGGRPNPRRSVFSDKNAHLAAFAYPKLLSLPHRMTSFSEAFVERLLASEEELNAGAEA
ncbi:hypothetical protein GCM10027449_14510 [Sinomonas notoginsengisoli]